NGSTRPARGAAGHLRPVIETAADHEGSEMSTASIRYAGSSVTSSHTDSPAHGSTGRAVGVWLALFAVVIFAIILVGGATRLTESGLSITEWKPVTGIFPPVTEAQWLVEFEKYKQIPQYLELNAGMS